MRVQTLHDMTPQKFDGIKTYGTQELAIALKSEQGPVLIDVWAGVNDAIPSAVRCFQVDWLLTIQPLTWLTKDDFRAY